MLKSSPNKPPVPTCVDNLTNTQLKKLIEKFGITARPTRELRIQQAWLLTARVDEIQIIRDAYREWLDSKKVHPSGSKPELHDWYGIDFNKVDLFDRRAYEVYGEMKRRNWYFSCFMALFSFSLTNICSWYEEKISFYEQRRFQISMVEFVAKHMVPVWFKNHPFPVFQPNSDQ
jgi:hypothetical protein